MDKKFWHNKKVFITGHTGFKGSWLTTWLKLSGATVIGYALPPATHPNLYTEAAVGTDIISLNGDIRDSDNLNRAVKTHQPDIVLHLAAQPLVHHSYQFPVETYSVNVMGTVNILEALRQVNTVRVGLVITSDKCYENQEWVWGYRETDPMGGFDPYSSSKGCAELVTSAYRRSYFNPASYDQHGLAIASARGGNIIGGGDFSDMRLIPDLIRAFEKKEVAKIRCPQAYRPWQYILDVLHGYVLLVEQLWEKKNQYAEAWNFGPDQENIKPVSYVADKVASLWGGNAKWCTEGNALHEARSLKLDSNKSRTLLGWQPKMSLEAGLKHTIDWYLKYRDNRDIQAFTIQQIKDYEASGSISNGD